MTAMNNYRGLRSCARVYSDLLLSFSFDSWQLAECYGIWETYPFARDKARNAYAEIRLMINGINGTYFFKGIKSYEFNQE